MQEAVLEAATPLGFVSEAKGLFGELPTSALRPDYYLPIGESGILLEVERGKTTINNMDLLDFWKCHLCEHANYLFLMVPQELRQNPTMSPRSASTRSSSSGSRASSCRATTRTCAGCSSSATRRDRLHR